MAAAGTKPLPEALTDLVGDTIASSYRLDEIIGSGGMGVVFGGMQLKLKRPIAVKVLDPDVASSGKGGKERFKREAESVARLDHLNCLQVYDYGTTPGGLHYMVMPRLSGRSLSGVLADGNLTPRHALALTIQVLAGLEHAHAQGIVHRDLKPANIFVVDTGGEEVVKIVDFGIAKILDEEADPEFKTKSGLLFGTPAYMSPEQAVGEAIDARADLYALGIVLFRLVAGQIPHRAKSIVDQMRKRATLDVPELPDPCPETLSTFMRWLCARDLGQRCPSASAAKRAAQELLAAAPLGDPAWDEPYVFVEPFAGGGETRVEDGTAVTSLSSLGIEDSATEIERPGDDVSTSPADLSATRRLETDRLEPGASTARAKPAAALIEAVDSLDAAEAPDLATGNADETRAVTTSEPTGPGRAGVWIGVGAVALVGAISWATMGGSTNAPPATPTVSAGVSAGEEPRPQAPAAVEPRVDEAPPVVNPPAADEVGEQPLDLLEKLTRVNVSDPAEALPFSERHELLAELRSDERAAKLIDERGNAVVDLTQAGDAPAPCEAFDRAIQRLADSTDRDVRRAVRRAKVPRGDPERCAAARQRLREARESHKRTPASEAVASDPLVEKGPTEKTKPGEITPKLGGLK